MGEEPALPSRASVMRVFLMHEALYNVGNDDGAILESGMAHRPATSRSMAHQRKRRLRLTDGERRRLGRLGKVLGRKALRQVDQNPRPTVSTNP